MRVQYQREKRAKTMISKEIRIAKTLRCKASKPSYSRCHDCIKPSILSQLRDGRHSSRCPAEWIHFTQGWIFVLEAKLMGKEHIWKNCRYFCWVYLWQLYHTSEINYTYMHAWHLISINCWKWGSGVAKTVVGCFFFPLAFLLYLLTQIFHNLWKAKQLIWDWEDMKKATSSWDTLGTAFNGLARGRFLYVWVHTGSQH